MKKCPYCAEDIQDDAILCRYCGSSLLDKKNFSVTSMEGKNRKHQKTSFWSLYRDGLIITTLLWIVRLILGPSSMEWGDILMGPVVIALVNFVMGLPGIWLA